MKLQEKLRSALKGCRGLNIQVSEKPWDEGELKDAAWIVDAYLQSQDCVLDGDDPLRTWLEEYSFYSAAQ
jgi:hypothetical protein